MMADEKKVLRLLKTARGQMDGIIKMVEENRYCIDISQQLMATEAILNRANKDLFRLLRSPRHVPCPGGPKAFYLLGRNTRKGYAASVQRQSL